MDFLETEDQTTNKSPLRPKDTKNRQTAQVSKVLCLEDQIPLLGYCKPCLSQGRSRTFLCEDPKGRLLGMCVHEITNGKLLRSKFGQYLTILKQSTKIWPPGDTVKGTIIHKVNLKPRNTRIWVEHYMDVFHTNLLINDGTVYMLLAKYNKFKDLVVPYLSLKLQT